MQEWIRQVLGSSQLTLAALPAAFLLGLLGAVSSCCNVAAVGAIAGYSGSRENVGRHATVLVGLSFMLGTIVALAALGAVAGFVSQVAGSALGRYWKIFAGLAAIFFGLAALNLVPFKLPTVGSTVRARPRGLLAATVFGLAIAQVPRRPARRAAILCLPSRWGLRPCRATPFGGQLSLAPSLSGSACR